MLKNIKGAIFDLDGTLVDSMWVWRQIDVDYLKSKGHSLPENLNSEICHLSFTQTANYFKKRFNLSDSIETILDDWHNMAYNHYSKNVKLKDGVKEFLDKLKNNNVKIALATSNSVPLLEACLKNNGIYDYFDAITTTDEVPNGKNCPDVYLLAAEKININPSDCIVFEDILAAINGAKAANMTVVAVHDEHSSNELDEIIKASDKYINSYFELI
ncbi:HAD family phosphatase [uncultured Clostridium sp.]|uniref:HAD family hydrolase n=1 Tax=uncultured Clostridium sp. TaxID=59620 RepID=UPI0025F58477|nr:HAD family phosphatase [uncultured Clostridium sp.]